MPRKQNNKRATVFFLAIVLAISIPAFAQESQDPASQGYVYVQYFCDWNPSSDAQTADFFTFLIFLVVVAAAIFFVVSNHDARREQACQVWEQQHLQTWQPQQIQTWEQQQRQAWEAQEQARREQALQYWETRLLEATALALATDYFSDEACRANAQAKCDELLEHARDTEGAEANRLLNSNHNEAWYAYMATIFAQRSSQDQAATIRIMRMADEWPYRLLQEAKKIKMEVHENCEQT